MMNEEIKMTKQYKKRLIELAKRIDSTQDGQLRAQWIQHLIGYILALEEIK